MAYHLQNCAEDDMFTRLLQSDEYLSQFPTQNEAGAFLYCVSGSDPTSSTSSFPFSRTSYIDVITPSVHAIDLNSSISGLWSPQSPTFGDVQCIDPSLLHPSHSGHNHDTTSSSSEASSPSVSSPTDYDHLSSFTPPQIYTNILEIPPDNDLEIPDTQGWLGVAHDGALLERFLEVSGKLATGQNPSKEDAAFFVQMGSVGGPQYICGFIDCTWHERGWPVHSRGVKHVQTNHFKSLRFQCESCPKTFQWKQDLKSHMKTQHSARKAKFPCEFCDEEFSKLWNLKRHYGRYHKDKTLKLGHTKI